MEIENFFLFVSLKTDVEWRQKDLGAGQDLIQRIVKTVTGKQLASVRNDFKEIGDYGSILENSQRGQNTLSVYFGKTSQKKEDEKLTSFQYVFGQIKNLSDLQGDKSKQFKEDLMVGLIRGLNSIEGKYVIRFLSGNLKIGAAEKIFQISLARAFCQYFSKEKSFFKDSIDY